MYLEHLDVLPVGDADIECYTAVINKFLRAGFRVHEIHHDTLKNMEAFGADDAFFEEDRLLIMDWCQGIISMHNAYLLREYDAELKNKPKPDLDQAGNAKPKRLAKRAIVKPWADPMIDGIPAEHHQRFS